MDGSATFIRNGFMVQHLQPQNPASHDFVWIKLMNPKVPFNVVVIYLVSGSGSADNVWKSQLWGELKQEVTSLSLF